MILHSTNGKSDKVPLQQGVAPGLAPDGGLYMPDRFPRLPQAFFNNLTGMSLQEIAFVITTTLFGDIIDAPTLKKTVYESLDFEIPLTNVHDDFFLLELFHGPTQSFKDIGARFMARLLPLMAPLEDEYRDIIVATSGDSGGAVANGFRDTPRTRVIVLFPNGELSSEQISRFISEKNVLPIEVNGTFDDCQDMAKKAILSEIDTPSGHNIVSGNSINLLRQLPSIIYYFHAYARAMEQRPGQEVVISVPCGNLGNLSAALMAKKMGLPAKRFIAANNANDVFVEYLKTGDFHPKEALITIARAMDVGNPSNLARIIDLYDGDMEQIRTDVEGMSVDDPSIRETMRKLADSYGVITDPHTASAFAALATKLKPGETGIALASAHPAKSGEVVSDVTGRKIQSPQSEAQPTDLRDARIVKIPPTLSALHRAMLIENHNK